MTDPALEEHVLAIIEAQSKGELQSESIVRRFQESEQVSEQQVAAAHSELHRIVSTHDSLQYSEERLQAIQLSILLAMSQCKVPVVSSRRRSCPTAGLSTAVLKGSVSTDHLFPTVRMKFCKT